MSQGMGALKMGGGVRKPLTNYAVSDRFSLRNENLSGIVQTLFVLFRFITICSVYINHKSYSKI